MRDRVIFAALGGFISGVLVRSFFPLPATAALLCVLLGLLFAAIPSYRKSVPVALAAVFLIGSGFGIVRYAVSDAGSDAFASSVGEAVSIEGIIVDEPDRREMNTHLVLETPDTDARILLIAPRESEMLYGDRVRVRGKLSRPDNFTDERTLREVDYRSHLRKSGIGYEMFLPNIELIASHEGNAVVERLFAWKRAFLRNIRELLPEPHASLLGGLIVGAKQSLGKELLDDFRTVGVIHIVVLSGYNITIIARFIEWFFSRLRKQAQLIISAAGMILFAIMVGASATVVRATIMALLVLLAHGTGRIYAATRALLFAGVIMLLHNPQILVFDTSFQLSFLATVGLIYLSPLIEPKVKWVTEVWGLRGIVVATVATQLFVLPFILYKMGTFSLVSLPVNFLILAAIPLTMLFGFLSGILGFISYALAAPFAFLAYVLLSYELIVVELFSRLPFAEALVTGFPAWLAVLAYGMLGAVLYVLYKKHPPHRLTDAVGGDGRDYVRASL